MLVSAISHLSVWQVCLLLLRLGPTIGPDHMMKMTKQSAYATLPRYEVTRAFHIAFKFMQRVLIVLYECHYESPQPMVLHMHPASHCACSDSEQPSPRILPLHRVAMSSKSINQSPLRKWLGESLLGRVPPTHHHRADRLYKYWPSPQPS